MTTAITTAQETMATVFKAVQRNIDGQVFPIRQQVSEGILTAEDGNLALTNALLSGGINSVLWDNARHGQGLAMKMDTVTYVDTDRTEYAIIDVAVRSKDILDILVNVAGYTYYVIRDHDGNVIEHKVSVLRWSKAIASMKPKGVPTVNAGTGDPYDNAKAVLQGIRQARAIFTEQVADKQYGRPVKAYDQYDINVKTATNIWTGEAIRANKGTRYGQELSL